MKKFMKIKIEILLRNLSYLNNIPCVCLYISNTHFFIINVMSLSTTNIWSITVNFI